MSNENTEKKPSFDPVKLEQVNVNVDYPMEPDEFEILYKHNCYCHMAHISKFGYPIVTPMFYVVLEDGFIYISSVQKYRAKIDHLIANPKISVSISNDGSNARRKRQFRITVEHRKMPDVAPDRVRRHFHADEPNRIWVGDVTFIRTRAGWLYLAMLLDLYSRKVVGLLLYTLPYKALMIFIYMVL